jgi:gliding motility-associated-like protein
MKQILILISLALFLAGCSKKSKQVTYKLSEDLCLVCDSTPYKVLGNDTIQLENIITPNSDSENDQFYIQRYHNNENLDSINLTIFDRSGKQIVHFDHYMNNWPKYIPTQNRQDLAGLSNGLYRYRLSSGSGYIDGLFILIFEKDEYIDQQAGDAVCFHCIRCISPYDPALFNLLIYWNASDAGTSTKQHFITQEQSIDPWIKVKV